MRRKLKRLYRYNTEEHQSQFFKIPKHHNPLSGTQSVNKLREDKRLSHLQESFTEKSFNLVNRSPMTKLNFRVHCDKIIDLNLTKPSHFNNQKVTSMRKFIRQVSNQPFASIISRQVKHYQKSEQKTMELLKNIFFFCDQIIEEIYSYNKVQGLIKTMNSLFKVIESKSITFLGYCLSAQCLFMYGSYSLSIFYSDKALKLLGQKQKIYIEQRQAQIDLYRTIAKIFVTKNNFVLAKDFAYKYLRKAWFIRDFEKELQANDLLGKIYHECEQKAISIYFHNRMCKGEKQDQQIIKISNYELEKSEKDKPQFAVYETIDVFIQGDRAFHEMLQDRYRMKSRSFELQNIQLKTQFYFHTNRSPNRNLDTYRVLERKMIEQKKSKQLHFIKPKQKGNLRKVVIQFSNLIKEVQQQFCKESLNSIETNRDLLKFK